MKGARTVRTEIIVTKHITELKNSTIQINTKQNSALRILSQSKMQNVITKNFVHSRTIRLNSQLNWLKIMKLTWTSTCSTSRQFGAPTVRTTTIEKCVFTHIIGKTTEGDLQFSHILPKCALIGRQTILSHLTPKAVLISTNANFPMVGKNKNTTQISSKSKSASTARTARNHTVRTTIQTTIGRLFSTSGFDTFQRAGSRVSHQTSMYPVMVLNRTRWQINRPRFHVCQPRLSVTKGS